MRGNIVSLLAAALMGVCGVASADIIYNVDITDGVETVTGTITTDGASGVLTAADFLSWSLSASGPVTGSDVGPPALAFCSVCGIEVVGDTMEFIGGAGNPALLLVDPFTLVVIVFEEGAVSVQAGGFPAFILETTPYVIGTVGSVPEPPSAILLGIGLACLGLACTRARRRPSAAV